MKTATELMVHVGPSYVPPSMAEKIAMLQELLGGLDIVDEHGNVIGKTEPLITVKQARKLLFPESVE